MAVRVKMSSQATDFQPTAHRQYDTAETQSGSANHVVRDHDRAQVSVVIEEEKDLKEDLDSAIHSSSNEHASFYWPVANKPFEPKEVIGLLMKSTVAKNRWLTTLSG